MPGVKTRKGEVQKQKVIMCDSCGEQKKPVLFMNGGKKKNALMCDCGIWNKAGEKIHTFSV